MAKGVFLLTLMLWLCTTSLCAFAGWQGIYTKHYYHEKGPTSSVPQRERSQEPTNTKSQTDSSSAPSLPSFAELNRRYDTLLGDLGYTYKDLGLDFDGVYLDLTVAGNIENIAWHAQENRVWIQHMLPRFENATVEIRRRNQQFKLLKSQLDREQADLQKIKKDWPETLEQMRKEIDQLDGESTKYRTCAAELEKTLNSDAKALENQFSELQRRLGMRGGALKAKPRINAHALAGNKTHDLKTLEQVLPIDPIVPEEWAKRIEIGKFDYDLPGFGENLPWIKIRERALLWEERAKTEIGGLVHFSGDFIRLRRGYVEAQEEWLNLYNGICDAGSSIYKDKQLLGRMYPDILRTAKKLHQTRDLDKTAQLKVAVLAVGRGMYNQLKHELPAASGAFGAIDSANDALEFKEFVEEFAGDVISFLPQTVHQLVNNEPGGFRALQENVATTFNEFGIDSLLAWGDFSVLMPKNLADLDLGWCINKSLELRRQQRKSNVPTNFASR